jgi:hypothetical protein
MNDNCATTKAEESTLLSSLNELVDISWQLHGQVYIENNPTPIEAPNKLSPGNKISLAKDIIMSVTQRLKEVNQVLKTIGK